MKTRQNPEMWVMFRRAIRQFVLNKDLTATKNRAHFFYHLKKKKKKIKFHFLNFVFLNVIKKYILCLHVVPCGST
jgi:hypothetical protein